MSRDPRATRALRMLRTVITTVLVVVVVAASTAATAYFVGVAARSVSGDRNAPWIIGRAAGVTSYLLMVALVVMGLVLSHPWRTRVHRPSTATRLRLHVSLGVFTLVFTVLHVVVLATDSYAKVGWWGALVPMGSQYRPVPVTLGLIGLYAGVLAGLTAALSGHLAVRVWWPIHKVSSLSLVLVWAHAVLAGVDTPVLLAFYLITGGGVVALAVTRYAARTPRDLVRQLQDSPRAALHQGLRAVDRTVDQRVDDAVLGPVTTRSQAR